MGRIHRKRKSIAAYYAEIVDAILRIVAVADRV
jgi:hypothetical protein